MIYNNLKQYIIDQNFNFDLTEEEFKLFTLQIIDTVNKKFNEQNDITLLYKFKNQISIILKDLYLINTLKNKVSKLQKLDLPKQRSKEWFDLRKRVLTASSLASALNKDHFKSKYELIESKIIEKPFEYNEITEHGVKYEEIATQFYEHLNNVKILEFGLIPHPDFPIFGASPDGICDNNSPNEYIGRMLEIKCPPKRKFTKTVPNHYKYQILGQLECCDLEECDFFQVKISEYSSVSEYNDDVFTSNGEINVGYNSKEYPKGCILTYKNSEDKYQYLYPGLFKTYNELNEWIEDKKQWLIEHEFKFEKINWWKIERYECTLVKRNKIEWADIIDDIIDFYKELDYYKNNISELQEKLPKKKVIFINTNDCLL